MILASTARRVRETLEQLGIAHAPLPETHFEQDLYLASAEALMEHVRRVPDCTDLLLVGHNPGLQELALDLVSSHDSCFTGLQAKFPTGALLRMRVDCPGWAELRGGQAVVELFLRPRDLES